MRKIRFKIKIIWSLLIKIKRNLKIRMTKMVIKLTIKLKID